MTSGESAADFWCDGDLVTVGDTRYGVLSDCGEPDFKETRYEKRIKRDFYRDLFRTERRDRYHERELYREPFLVEEFVEIDTWTYNFGPTKFIRYVVFENGIVVDIKTGDYGY
jgi:hypothetical protein